MVDDVPPIQTWNRTPGKPSLSTSLGALPSTAAWGPKKKVISNAASSGAAASKDAWPMLSDSSLPLKNKPSQWPAPADFAGTSLDDTINDFSIPNSWNAPGTSLALRALSDANNLNDPWPPLDTSQSSNPIEPVSASRSITDNGHPVSNKNAFDLCPQIHSTTSDKGFSGWASAVDDQQLPSTADNKIAENLQQPAETLCSNVSDPGDHINAQSETSGLISTLINSKECWGRCPVNQTTFWDVAILNEESASSSRTQASTGILGDFASLAMKQRRSVRGINNSSVESNVWSSEPPTGTGVWEMHYEGLGDKAGLWKQPSSSFSNAGAGITDCSGDSQGDVASPTESHRLVPSFKNSSVQQRGGSGGFKNHIFPSQSQQRFSQATSQSTTGLGRGALGPNSMLDANAAVGSAFKLQPSAGWSFSLTPDGQSPLEDTKRFITSSGPWGSESLVLGKQQQALNDTTRWPFSVGLSSAPTDGVPSPVFAAPPPWQSDMDPRKFVPWSHQTAVASQPPLSALPQRFHLRQNTSGIPIVTSSPASSSPSTQPMRLHSSANQHPLTNPQHAPSFTTSLRTDIAKQLMVLGLHDDAVVFLSDNSIEDFEKFLYEVRERTGGMHPGLNQLIQSVSTFLMAAGGFGPAELQQQQQLQLRPPPQTFDLFDNRGGSAAFHTNKPYFAGRLNPSSPSEALGQLLMRESHLQSTIIQLDKKKRELSMKHLQLRKINMDGPTAHHSNSMLQEIVMQQAQISRQIEAQEAQLGQVRLQIAFLARTTTGGGNGASSNRMTNHTMGALGGGGPRGSGMLLNSPAPADLALRLADLKVSMDMGHQTSWEGGGGSSVGGWDVPSPQQFNHASSSNVVLNNDTTSNVFPFGNRRWTAYNASSDFHQPPIPSPTTTAAAVANAIWNASWLLLSDLTPQFSLEVLGMAIATALDQQQNGAIGKSTCNASSTYEVHPNLSARYVLIGFRNHADASVVSAFISAANSTIKLANSVVMISPAEAVAKLQEIKA